jgi:seryl-tRNA synthetase
MKLSKRIRDLVRANLASPRGLAGLGQVRSPAKLEARLEYIRKSLVRSAGREKQLQDELALAEQQGREQDAARLRREMADLSRSTDELQSALDLIQARIEMLSESKDLAAQPSSATGERDLDALQASPSQEESKSDLAARKARLAAPEGKDDSTADTTPD